MLTDFIEKALAQIDDLAELKVTLVTLSLLEKKNRPAAHVMEAELLAHPVIAGLSFPEITLALSLQKAVARGTFIQAKLGEASRYFINNGVSQLIAELLEDQHQTISPVIRYQAVIREIERLELRDGYRPTDKELEQLRDWSFQGYAIEEMVQAVKTALHSPRAGNASPRVIKHIAPALVTQPPHTPTDYYAVVIAKNQAPSEDILALRELLRRWPNGHEFNTARSAVTLFGLRNVIDGMKRLAQGREVDIDALLPLLAEQEDADLAFERSRASVDVAVRDLLRLYESTIGLPPTEYVARDIKSVYDGDVKDLATWRAVFEYAAQQNKKDWRYIRTLLLNPSPNVFMPQAANAVAQFAFDEYKRRVGRLDPSVANEINTVALAVADEIKWRAAFDAAARANAINWNYIKKVLTSDENEKNQKAEQTSDGKRKRATPQQNSKQPGKGYRLPQVEYTDEQREAARERARQRIAKRAQQATPPTKDH